MLEDASSSKIIKTHRISELDVLRGFALLGIFMVNILGMNCGFTFNNDWTQEQTGFINQSSLFIIDTFFHSKFFPIFSLLFGIGIALQMEGIKKKDTSNSFFSLNALDHFFCSVFFTYYSSGQVTYFTCMPLLASQYFSYTKVQQRFFSGQAS